MTGCDDTRLGRELAEDFPEETAHIDDAFDRLAHPEDYLMAPVDVCKHCGEPIRRGDRDVEWPWIHDNGWYQCSRTGSPTLAEPDAAGTDPA